MPLEYALQFRNHFPPANPYKTVPPQQHFDSANLGIGTLSHQVVRRFRQTPFTFNLMIVGKLMLSYSINTIHMCVYLCTGETGLGKSTFINTLFYSDLVERKLQHRIGAKTLQITPHKFGMFSSYFT